MSYAEATKGRGFRAQHHQIRPYLKVHLKFHVLEDELARFEKDSVGIIENLRSTRK